MTLPDRFEQAGVLVGSVVLLALPTSALATALLGPGTAWPAVGIWIVPGVAVGIPLALGALPVTYREVWAFSLSTCAFVLALWAVLGLSAPPAPADRGIAVGAWIVAAAAGAAVARTRPIRSAADRLRPA